MVSRSEALFVGRLADRMCRYRGFVGLRSVDSCVESACNIDAGPEDGVGGGAGRIRRLPWLLTLGSVCSDGRSVELPGVLGAC